MDIEIKGLGTATPALYMTQKEMLAHFIANFALSTKEKDLYERILSGSTIKRRYVGMESRDEMFNADPEFLLSRFLKYGLSIAVSAARKAMKEAGVSSKDIEGLVVNTCTGYLCPGLSSYVAEELGLRKSTHVMDLMGMGCGGAVPNLECAAGMISRNGRGPILSIAVEICSATFFPSHEPELIVSNCIFGDGAAAVVVDSPDREGRVKAPRILDFESGVYPEYRDELRYRNDGGLLRNYLSIKVPVIGAKTISEVTSRLIERHGLSKDDIDWWAVHPGGTLVLAQVAKKMKLDEKALRFSYDVFENYGNMSSPSVLFVLKDILEKAHPKPGQKGLLLSFGAGFTAFAALVEF
ncbi:MAG: type III polyketide synthase [Victivallales bacterium]|jgi:alkylresorcinol/alkylpyrone synthase